MNCHRKRSRSGDKSPEKPKGKRHRSRVVPNPGIVSKVRPGDVSGLTISLRERMGLKHETSGLNSDTCTVSLARPVISRFLFRHDSKEHGGKRGDGRIWRRAKDNVLRGFVPFFSSFACDDEGSTDSCWWNHRRGRRQILADQYGGRVFQPASAQPRFQVGTQRTLLITGLLVGGRGNKGSALQIRFECRSRHDV